MLTLSTRVEPSVAVYPDGDRLGVWPGDRRDSLPFRRGEAVGCRFGETGRGGWTG